jgi:hypothetical protein
MKATIFPLTIRRADVLELYEHQFRFSLLDPPIVSKLLYATLCAVTAYLAFSWLKTNGDFFILLYGSLIGFGAFLIQILEAYRAARKKKAEINTWIDTFIHFKAHEVVVEAERIVYRNECQVFAYPFNTMSGCSRHGSGFHLQMLGQENLSIPVRAFELGDSDRFGTIALQMFADYLATHKQSEEAGASQPGAAPIDPT